MRPDKSNAYDAEVKPMTRRLAREPISPALLDELQRPFWRRFGRGAGRPCRDGARRAPWWANP
jgi:hypothetical protein